MVVAELLAAVLWNLLTWYLGLPSSSSHALVGGLLGAAVLAEGVGVVRIDGLTKIMIALLISPVLGLLGGFLTMKFTMTAARTAPPSVNNWFRRGHIVALLGLALGHGTNGAQKTMGVIIMGLLAGGLIPSFQVPIWVIAVSAGAIALGTALGGWRLIRTLGARIYRIRPIHGFASQIAGASVIMGAAMLGGPVSTTQVMSSAIMGVGAVVEALAGVRLHKQNLRRLVESAGLVERTGRFETETGARPAELFRFRREVLHERPAPGVRLPGTRSHRRHGDQRGP